MKGIFLLGFDRMNNFVFLSALDHFQDLKMENSIHFLKTFCKSVYYKYLHWNIFYLKET